ncbi:hypothetical protein PsW64_05060 [Pseudovibrio sp. W64]|uniref:hypothetical protein n=1 Tax=unclassified Pseudovibrio TaxID=2627060 RepID=UPI0007AED83A|nr:MULTISPECIES: hypothetical protein [unclassified Pseudovibrio]KZK76336.1 hypothetical protein PsW64_05060 [Pseudovibrio sp. W64]KZK80916.1 hypothetical protein PsAD46_03964 [Pseudovibrio sp. Ad46]KZK82179.1 hypothetical protein PsAD13_03733 [Pseudovibrio sp. Ad13]KZL02818.1 hypothetical protein PsW74_01012 [Pseudovibrio sp. W74]KZL06403.1 hypothetical protein PsAD26_03654 [Pseudovibrio sp. Ad26]
MLDGKTNPLNFPPRGLGRVDAAKYIGISASLFDELVAKRLMPDPKMMNTRKVWDIRELDRAFDELPHSNQSATTNSNLPSDFV